MGIWGSSESAEELLHIIYRELREEKFKDTELNQEIDAEVADLKAALKDEDEIARLRGHPDAIKISMADIRKRIKLLKIISSRIKKHAKFFEHLAEKIKTQVNKLQTRYLPKREELSELEKRKLRAQQKRKGKKVPKPRIVK